MKDRARGAIERSQSTEGSVAASDLVEMESERRKNRRAAQVATQTCRFQTAWDKLDRFSAACPNNKLRASCGHFACLLLQ